MGVVFLIFCSFFFLSSCESVTDQNSDSTDSRTAYSRLYGYLYWEYGLPVSDAGRRSDSWVTDEMKDNPDLIIQTGFYNLRFAADELALTGFDASEGSDYLTALNEDVTEFSAADLQIEIDAGGVTYQAEYAEVEDSDSGDFQLGLIEQGQYVQRFDHTGLVFKDEDGNSLDLSSAYHYFEITAWPDQVVFTLDMSNFDEVTRSKITIISPDGVVHTVEEATNKVNLAVAPAKDETLSELDPAQYITSAYNVSDDTEFEDVSFDADQHAFFFDLPSWGIWYDEGVDSSYKELQFEVTNPTDEAINVPLVFNLNRFNTITGTVMTLVEEDGRPSGYAVQVSKNWHGAGSERKHVGSWHTGSAVIPLEANSSRTLKLRVIYGYWDDVGTASHSHLSLIGYTDKAWQWDESALGAWGESMTFSPVSCIGSAFMDDIRPTYTTPMSDSSTDHAWTENVGGGDYLVYFDENGDFRWPKKLKTAYRWIGPNMTQVFYGGITDDEAVRFTFGSHLVRSNDYHRRFQEYEYEILQAIEPTRFVYYQMAADYYMTAAFDDYYRGDGNGVIESHIGEEQGGNEYLASYLFDERWLAIADESGTSDDAHAYRGLIWRDSTVNGEDAELYMHNYGRTWTSDTVLFGFGSDSTTPSLAGGTQISGEIEFIMPAQTLAEYWGSDAAFSERLDGYSEPWEAISDEYSFNDMTVVATNATVTKSYPVTVEPSTDSVDVQITVPAGKGIGHIPVIIENATAGQALYAQVYVDGQWVAAVENEAAYEAHAYYQGYFNADGSMDYAFNIIRPDELGFDESMQIRIQAQ
jgi:hypothetical protein